MSFRVILFTIFAFLLSKTSLKAQTLQNPLKKKDEATTADENRNVLIFRASESLLKFSKKSESYRFGGGYQRRLGSKWFSKLNNFSKSVGTYFEYQSNKYGDKDKDSILQAYVGMQFDYIKSESALDGAFFGIYPAIGRFQKESISQKSTKETVAGFLVEVGKSINVTNNLKYRPNVGYRSFTGRVGEVVIRPLEFSIEF